MARRTVVVDRDTPLLLPPSIQEWIPEDDMARFVVDAVDVVEDSLCRYNWTGSGSYQYPPRMMLALLVYCYAHGTFSSRKIERATWRDVAVRYITGDHHPDHDTIAAFRRDNAGLFQACFTRVLRLASEMHIKRIGEVAIDGSKIEADAAKRRAISAQDLDEQTAFLERRVAELTARAEATDQSEAGSPDFQRLAGKLARATDRRAALLAAKALLEEKTRAAAARREAERDDHDDDGPGEKPRAIDPAPAAQDTIHLTDPAARLLPQKKGGYAPSYNVQIAVRADPTAPLILAHTVCDESNDRRQLAPMTGLVMEQEPDTRRILVDTGYDNSAQIHRMEMKHGVTIYCPPEEQAEREPQGKPLSRQSAARKRTVDYRHGMRACMRTTFGQTSQRLRATTVEPVFAWIKHTLGFKRFHLRGMGKVRAEWNLVCLAHNLALLHRHHRRAAAPA